MASAQAEQDLLWMSREWWREKLAGLEERGGRRMASDRPGQSLIGWMSPGREGKPVEHLFGALFMVSQLLMGEIAAGAVFSCCGSVGFGPSLSKRLRLPLWVTKGLVGRQHGGRG